MIVLVRADANHESGIGHVMRCAALGMRLMRQGATVHFLCNELPGELDDWLLKHRFGLTIVRSGLDFTADLAEARNVAKNFSGVDLLIVDHYQLDREWERGMRQHARRILLRVNHRVDLADQRRAAGRGGKRLAVGARPRVIVGRRQ